jgi:aromatic ring-opening dioxygenase catalytic subunit (LigB family)
MSVWGRKGEKGLQGIKGDKGEIINNMHLFINSKDMPEEIAKNFDEWSKNKIAQLKYEIEQNQKLIDLLNQGLR